MTYNRIPISDWVVKFDNHEFDGADLDTQIDAGWYDWFCRDTSLKNKTKLLGSRLKSLLPTILFDENETYVFFKNNCPVNGSLYDSFSICDLETGDVLFWVTPKSKHKDPRLCNKSVVVDVKEDNDMQLVFEKWKDVVKYFRTGLLSEITIII